MHSPDPENPSSLSLNERKRIDDLCDQFEKEWQKGNPPDMKSFVERAESDKEYVVLMRELLRVEFHYQKQSGNQPELAHYPFPEYQELVESEYLRFFETDSIQDSGCTPDHRNHSAKGDESDSANAWELPTTAGRYRIEERIGKGGMGAVLRVQDPEFERTLAVKIMLPESAEKPNAEKRFVEEAKLTGQLQHPGIPPVHELGKLDNGLPFFAMKLIKGHTLAQLLEQKGNRELGTGNREESDPIPCARFLGIFGQICQTIAYVHSRGVIHRDLKPSNIMVGAFGEVQVMDWGLAKVLTKAEESSRARPEAEVQSRASWSLQIHDSGNRTKTGDIMGTPGYMSPEQARGETRAFDPRCDVFALGSILCKILTGMPAVQGGSSLHIVLETADGNLDDAFFRLDECTADAELKQLCKRCLAPDSKDRPRNAGEVADAVASYEVKVQMRLRQAELQRAHAEVQAKEEMKRRQVERQKRSWTMVAAAALVLIICGIAAGALWYRTDRANLARADIKRRGDKKIRHARRVAQISANINNAQTISDALDRELAEPRGVSNCSLPGRNGCCVFGLLKRICSTPGTFAKAQR